jgi:hypothetical protein
MWGKVVKFMYRDLNFPFEIYDSNGNLSLLVKELLDLAPALLDEYVAAKEPKPTTRTVIHEHYYNNTPWFPLFYSSPPRTEVIMVDACSHPVHLECTSCKRNKPRGDSYLSGLAAFAALGLASFATYQFTMIYSETDYYTTASKLIQKVQRNINSIESWISERQRKSLYVPASLYDDRDDIENLTKILNELVKSKMQGVSMRKNGYGLMGISGLLLFSRFYKRVDSIFYVGVTGFAASILLLVAQMGRASFRGNLLLCENMAKKAKLIIESLETRKRSIDFI